MPKAPRRILRTPKPQAPVVIPMGVKLMHLVAGALFVLVFCMACAMWLWRAVHIPFFSLQSITLAGNTTHSSEHYVRRHVLRNLHGNYFTIRLDDVQEAFVSQPWVRSAVVHRLFPNALRVQLQEHKEAALWRSPNTDPRLLSSDGIIFDANPDESEHDNLPELSGPDHSAPMVLSAWRMLNPMVAPLETRITHLSLDERGSWKLKLEQNTTIMLGQAQLDQLQHRVAQFVETIATVAARHKRSTRDVLYADLRYPSGYAVRLKGVNTLAGSNQAAQSQTGRNNNG